MLKEITVEQARNEKNSVFIDVREQDEWNEGHIDGAVFCPLSLLKTGATFAIPDDKTCIIYCRSGQRSKNAIGILTEQGHDNLVNLQGGYLAWCENP